MLPQLDEEAHTALSHRRRELSRRLGGAPILVTAGRAPSRNYPANQYDFRACSHFLYLVGLPLPDAALLLNHCEAGRSTLFVPPPAEDDALWHGELPSLDALRALTGVDAVRPIDELQPELDKLERLSAVTRLPLPQSPSARDEELALGVIELRLRHDACAVRELRRAAAVTTAAHAAGMRATRVGATVASVRAAMEERVLAADFTMAYPPIVTTRGEILHCYDRSGTLSAGDLLLADVGAESDTGWASDVTRTWPATGRFSPSQRAVYELVLAAQRDAIAAVRPGVRYRDVHLVACRTLCRGLVDEGLLSGQVDGLVERGAHALFFPHGVGHLLGLDVHDMEDLGDRAGYAPGRRRSSQFGLAYLRLDRDLTPGMAVTIEPGLYFVPAILQRAKLTAPFADCFHPERLSRFADVRGIRIEDDVLVTETGSEVLTADIPKTVAAVEAAVGGGEAR
ncbi:MAG: aminopeptidase P family protein [Polyangia bacterium]